jgi:hypothetical protein
MPLLYEVIRVPAVSPIPVVKVSLSPVQKKETAESELVTGLSRIAQRTYARGAEFTPCKAIVDNIKALVKSEIEDRMVDLKNLCDEIATVSAQMTEMKEIIDKISTSQQHCIDDSYAVIREIARKQQLPKEAEEAEEVDEEVYEESDEEGEPQKLEEPPNTYCTDNLIFGLIIIGIPLIMAGCMFYALSTKAILVNGYYIRA